MESPLLLRSHLPANREAEGQFWVEDDAHKIIFGPVRCRGEADNTNAAKRSNVVEDPTKVGGDHPGGTYNVVKAVSFSSKDKEFHTYGPWFFLLDPTSGEALTAKQQGRAGLGIHGGAPGPNNILRVTYGCLRLDDDMVKALSALVVPALASGARIVYACHIDGTPAITPHA